MKKIISIFSFMVVLLVSFVLVSAKSVLADVGDTTIWNMKGAYTVDFTCVTGCSGTYTHTMNVVAMNDETGNFSGTGFYNADNSYTWDINGNVNGNNNALNFHLLYTGTLAGYTLDAVGNVKFDGTFSGTGTDSLGRTFTFQSTSGKAKHEKIHVKQEVSKKECNGVGKPIIDITEKVKNDVDSGFGGNNWAFDNYKRNIKVWKTATVGGYCAEGKYEGDFSAVVGQVAPAGTGVVGSSFTKDFDGGFRSIEFTGVQNLTPGPHFSTKTGNVGTFDYGCNIAGNCPGYFSWVSEYFSSSTFDYAWWGWTYHGGKRGTWINASNGTSGNIL